MINVSFRCHVRVAYIVINSYKIYYQQKVQEFIVNAQIQVKYKFSVLYSIAIFLAYWTIVRKERTAKSWYPAKTCLSVNQIFPSQKLISIKIYIISSIQFLISLKLENFSIHNMCSAKAKNKTWISCDNQW